MTIINKEQIPLLRLLTLHQGLQLELRGKGLTAKTNTCYSIVKSELGFKGNKETVYNILTDYIARLQSVGESNDE